MKFLPESLILTVIQDACPCRKNLRFHVGKQSEERCGANIQRVRTYTVFVQERQVSAPRRRGASVRTSARSPAGFLSVYHPLSGER